MPRSLAAAACAATLSLLQAACASLPPPQADMGVPPIIVRLEPTHEFTDSGMVVQEDEAFFFTAVGQVQWDLNGRTVTSTPDGIDPVIGVKAGRGGLIARIDSTGKPFDVGARTMPFKYLFVHQYRYAAPPPLVMRTAGRLFLGFKGFQPGHHAGAFEVTIRRVKR